jgi:hypothetical protein
MKQVNNNKPRWNEAMTNSLLRETAQQQQATTTSDSSEERDRSVACDE